MLYNYIPLIFNQTLIALCAGFRCAGETSLCPGAPVCWSACRTLVCALNDMLTGIFGYIFVVSAEEIYSNWWTWLQIFSLYEFCQCWWQNKAFRGHDSFKRLDSIFKKTWWTEWNWHLLFLFKIWPTLKVHKNYSKFAFFSLLSDHQIL